MYQRTVVLILLPCPFLIMALLRPTRGPVKNDSDRGKLKEKGRRGEKRTRNEELRTKHPR
jgi:hypothetical protein